MKKTYFKETIPSIVVYDFLSELWGFGTMAMRSNVIKHGDFNINMNAHFYLWEGSIAHSNLIYMY